MTDQIIAELEGAANIIMAPPNVVTNEQRHTAESIFLDFRKTKSPYNICREILEKSGNQYVMFEAAEVIKNAIIREWAFLLDSDKLSLRQYLFEYVITHETPPFVRERILQVIAIMVKRSSIDDNGRERANLLREVESLIVNSEPQKKILGCSIITHLMQEYATTVKSTDVGLPWEVHFKAKKQFEATDLKRIFQFTIYLLTEVGKSDAPFADNMVVLVGHLLKILEAVLTWGYVSPFLPKRLIGIYEAVYEADAAPALKLPASWAEHIFNPDLLPLIFQIYWKVRDNDQLSHHALACLVQLASLSGRVMFLDESRLKYLHSYLIAFFKLVSNVTIKSRESIGIANIVKKLIIFFIHDIPKLTKDIKDTLLDEFTRLTCHFCEGAALEEAQQEEDRNFSDAFDGMLEAWTTILQEFGPATSDNNLFECAKRVFEKYVQCRLAPPDGCRGAQPDADKGDETEEGDRELYKDQLQAIGLFGRAVASRSVPLLFNLLESRTSTLFNSFQEIRNRALTISEAAGLDTLYEDIHWILLITGEVLCFDRDGSETTMIPSEIIRYSTECCSRGQCTVEASLQALQFAENNTTMPADFEKCDHIIRLFFDVMKLCYVEDYVIGLGMKQFLSPELGSTMMWFLNRFCVNYLMPTESYYTEMSPTFLSCLGIDTEGAQLVIRYVLKKIQSNVYYFQSETRLLQETIDCFCHIVSNKHKSIHIVNTTSLRELVILCESLEAGTMPQNGFRGMYRGFSLCGACLSTEPERMRSYFEGIMGSLQRRFESVCTVQGGLASKAEDQRTLVVIVDLLEAFIGLAKGSLMPTATLLFELLAPILNEMPAFMSAFNNYHVIVQLILELFGQVAKYMLCYLSPMDSKRLYESALATVQTYAKCNMNRFTTESFAEDTSFQDLALVLELLTFIISKDCFDLCVTSNDEEITVTASDVSLFGLSFILPLMSMDLLKYPSLCMQYYRLLVLVNDIYPEKICGLPQDLLQSLLKSIEIGLTNFGPDIVQICLDFVQGMASYVYRHKLVNTPLYEGLRPFLKMLIDLTLSHQINSDLISSASTSIYSLICCYQEDYRALVESLLQMQSDPMTRERLAAAFNNLVMNVEMNCERLPKLRFRDNFDKFIANVHGFLLIK